LAPFGRSGDQENAFQIQGRLQDFMQALVGIVRIEKELGEALAKIDELKPLVSKIGCDGNRNYNPGWHTALELTHMITVAEAIAKSAFERKESRGGHFREDYPDKSEELGKVNVMLKKAADGSMQLSKVQKEPLREDLKQIIEEMK